MQDVEFTIEHGKLWMLQTRNGKRSAMAAIRVAHDMAVEGLIDKKTALQRVTPEQIDQMLHPHFFVPMSKPHIKRVVFTPRVSMLLLVLLLVRFISMLTQ